MTKSVVAPVLAGAKPPEPEALPAFINRAEKIFSAPRFDAVLSALPSFGAAYTARKALASRLLARLIALRILKKDFRAHGAPNISFSHPPLASFCLADSCGQRVATDAEPIDLFNFDACFDWFKKNSVTPVSRENSLPLWLLRETAIKFCPNLSRAELSRFLRRIASRDVPLGGHETLAGRDFYWRRLYFRGYVICVACDRDRLRDLTVLWLDYRDALRPYDAPF